MLQYHFEAGWDSASSRADERVLKLQSAISSFQSELKFSLVYKSNLFNFWINWNWKSRFCFSHYVVIFFIFSEENIIFFKFICSFISNFSWVSECLTQWIMTCFDISLSHSQKQLEERKSDIFLWYRNAASSVLSDYN